MQSTSCTFCHSDQLALHSLLHDTGCVDISPKVVKEDMEEFLQEEILAFVVDTTVVVCRDH